MNEMIQLFVMMWLISCPDRALKANVVLIGYK